MSLQGDSPRAASRHPPEGGAPRGPAKPVPRVPWMGTCSLVAGWFSCWQLFLDFSFLSNLGIFTVNVVYTGEKTNLFADKIEMNLTTKDTKIFMNDTGKKVLIEGTK